MIPGIDIGSNFLDRYEVYNYLGDRTIHAVDLHRGNREVVLKILDGNPHDVALTMSFSETVDSIRLLNEHPNIIALRNGGWTHLPDCFYLVYDYIEGNPLDRLLAYGLRTPDKSSFCWPKIARVCEALSIAHNENIAHWDLNPSNILVTEDGATPKLADVGVNHLSYLLSYGAPHSYDVYASPERRSGSRADLGHTADFYSLGLVAYHILTGHPPAGNFRPREAIADLSIGDCEKDILRRMLSTNPAERYQASFDIIADIEKAVQGGKDLELYPLELPETALSQLTEAGVNGADPDHVKDWVIDQLGERGKRPVFFSYPSHWSTDRISLAGKEVVFSCTTRENSSVLQVVHVSFLTSDLENSRKDGMPLSVNFRVFVRESPGNDPRSEDRLASLHRALGSHYQQIEHENTRQGLRWLGLRDWDTVLRVQAAIVTERQDETLQYDGLLAEGDYVRFNLSTRSPQPGHWSANQTRLVVKPLGTDNAASQRDQPVGELRAVTDRAVVVSLPPNREVSGLPTSGHLAEDIGGDLANYGRQGRAVNAFQTARIANPRLADIVLSAEGVANAGCAGRVGSIDFLDPNVRDDENQREVVEQALAAEELFLIQGPPGTGKTTVITEIIYQELNRNPAAKILLSSQTNIAVDNVLEKLGETRLKDSILRMGRTGDERIREDWLIDNRIHIWNEGLRDRSSESLTRLLGREDTLSEIVQIGEDGTLDELLSVARREVDDLKRTRNENRMLVEETAGTETACDELANPIEDDEKWIAQQQANRFGRGFVQRILVAYWPPRKSQEGMDLLQLALRRDGLEESREKLGKLQNQLEERRELLQISNELVAASEEQALQRIMPISELLMEEVDLQSMREDPGAALTDLEKVLLIRKTELDQVSARIELLREWIDVIGDWSEEEKDDIQDRLIRNASIIGATCIYSGNPVLSNHTFDIVIVDEAGKATAPEVMVPLAKARKAILVGDEKQLPPYIDSEALSENRLEAHGFQFGPDTGYGDFEDFRKSLETSLFQSLVNKAQTHNPSISRSLTTQYRMHPTIGSLVSRTFYGDQLRNGIAASDRNHEIDYLAKSVYWYSTRYLPRDARREAGRYSNQSEVKLIAYLLDKMDSYYSKYDAHREVGVISGYASQVRALRTAIGRDEGTQWNSLGIEIASVDAFQGRDKDIVIFSAVRSNPGNRIGFLQDYRRINVALSRAKELLIIVGDDSTLGNRSLTDDTFTPLREVLEYIAEHPDECVLDRSEAAESQR